MAESELKMIQSREIYRKSNPQHGIVAGERERSFCIFQIHKPTHHNTAIRLGYENYKTDVEHCVKLAHYIYTQRGSFKDWSVYNNSSYLAYHRR